MTYDLVVMPLDEIRRATVEAIENDRSPMSVPFVRSVESADFVHVVEKFTRTLFGDIE